MAYPSLCLSQTPVQYQTYPEYLIFTIPSNRKAVELEIEVSK